MKISSLLSLGFAGVMAPSLVRGFGIHALENRITQLETDTEVLATANFAKDAEIASLHARLDELNAACDGDDGGWTPAVGQSWNYNLATPLKTNVDVDVFLIDMGKRSETHSASTLNYTSKQCFFGESQPMGTLDSGHC